MKTHSVGIGPIGCAASGLVVVPLLVIAMMVVVPVMLVCAIVSGFARSRRRLPAERSVDARVVGDSATPERCLETWRALLARRGDVDVRLRRGDVIEAEIVDP